MNQTTVLLKTIMSDQQTHAKWLNSLSYLEYRGFRKIVRSRSTQEMTFEVLLHTAEEVRHALFFKKQAIRLGGSRFNTFHEDNLLGAKDLKSYFYEIDSKTQQALKLIDKNLFSNAVYSLITWLVEKRALSIYHVYEKLLIQSSATFSLSGVLKEEGLHLQQIGENAAQFLRQNGYNNTLLFEIEESAFQKLWNSIEHQTQVTHSKILSEMAP